MTHRRLYWNERRVLAFPHPPRSVAAGATEDAVRWPAELIGDQDRPAPEKLRLRPSLAWLVTAEPGLGALLPDGTGPVTLPPVPSRYPGRASA
ncbi:hypothetical protein ACIP2Y_32015 [Streptomyces sviceus]|uniref:hypothetical protein n=1 Tax=Streptomyces sviceus TaxID=285530 RepID=UPI00382F3A62